MKAAGRVPGRGMRLAVVGRLLPPLPSPSPSAGVGRGSSEFGTTGPLLGRPGQNGDGYGPPQTTARS